MKKCIKNNLKVLVAFVLGIIVSGSCVYAATILYNSNQIGFDNTRLNLTLNNQSVDNVQDAIDAIYQKIPSACSNGSSSGTNSSPTCANSPFQIGDYINMTPTNTSFTPSTSYTGLEDFDTFKENAPGTTKVSGTLDPSELNEWRVIKINSDCTVEVVSEYVSSVDVRFAYKTGFMNYIWYLNEIAKQYANTTYTLDPATAPDGAFRNVGYNKDKQTAKITDSTRMDDQTLGTENGLWYQKTTSLNAEESLGGGDDGFAADLTLLNDAGISLVAYKPGTTKATSYWLASRLFNWDSTTGWHFHARYMYNYGHVSSHGFWYWVGSSFRTYDSYAAVRPIVTLKSGLTTSSGNGTASSHYTLSAS